MAQAQDAKALSEVERFRALIAQVVTRSWIRPDGVGKGLQCIVQVRLVPTGEVISVRITKSSGNAVFDRSVQAAVQKASPLPVPKDANVFEKMREVEFLFNPKE
jgi:colicin import membrane protein